MKRQDLSAFTPEQRLFLGSWSKMWRRVAKSIRPQRRIRIGDHALVLRGGGFVGAGWSKVWGPIWRYRESDERAFLNRHAECVGLEPVDGESLNELRRRIRDVWLPPKTGARS